MLRRQTAITDRVIDSHLETTPNPLTQRSKIASFAPYLAEIQRRKKIKTIRTRSKNNLYHDSSKTFRIKEKSALSLQKGLTSFAREAANTASQRNQLKAQPKQLLQQDFDYSKTIESKAKVARMTDNNFFNDISLRMKGKKQQKGQQKSIKRNKFQTLDHHRTRSQLGGDLNMYKISFTNVSKPNNQPKPQQETDYKKRAEQTHKKNNFRKNKYEALHSSAHTHDVIMNAEKTREGIQSDGNIILDKKQSNATINIEMDKLAEKQMSAYYQQVTNKQANRSIEKSTEKYFNCESYRPVKSRNDIQVYLNSFANPALQKDSKSTNEKSQKYRVAVSSLNEYAQLKNNELIGYDFSFRNEESDSEVRIGQLADFYQDSSSMNSTSQQNMQKQRQDIQMEGSSRDRRLQS